MGGQSEMGSYLRSATISFMACSNPVKIALATMLCPIFNSMISGISKIGFKLA